MTRGGWINATVDSDPTCRRVGHLQARARALADVVERHAVAQGEGPSLWYLGWAEAMLGDPMAGHRLILDGYHRHARFGMYAGCPLVLGYAAEARARARDIEGALVQFDEALALARRIGECVTLPDLLLRRARVQRESGDATGAHATLGEALDGARRAGALGLEVDALVALCDPGFADPSPRAALHALVDELPNDFDEERRAAAERALASP